MENSVCWYKYPGFCFRTGGEERERFEVGEGEKEEIETIIEE